KKKPLNLRNIMAISRSITTAADASAADVRPITETDRDAILVARVQSGEVAAFDILVNKYRERLYGIVYNLTSNREDAADLTQEAFIKAFTAINRFKGNSAFFTWLYRIAVNTSLSHLKKNRLRRFFSLESIQEEGASAEILDALAIKQRTERGALISELQ